MRLAEPYPPGLGRSSFLGAFVSWVGYLQCQMEIRVSAGSSGCTKRPCDAKYGECSRAGGG